MRRPHQGQGESPYFRVRAVGAPTPDWDALQALLEYVYKLGQERGKAAPAAESAPAPAPAETRTPPSGLQVAEFAARAAARVQNVTNASGAILALTVRGGDIVCIGRAGVAPEIGARLDPTSGLSGKCVLSGEPQVCLDAASDPRVNGEVCRDLGIRSMAMVPLRRQGAVVGLLSAFSDKPNHFDLHDLGALKYLEGVVVEELEGRQERREQQAAPTPKLEPVAAPVKAVFIAPATPAVRAILPLQETPQPEVSPAARDWFDALADHRRVVSIVLVVGVVLLVGTLLWRTVIFHPATPAPRQSAVTGTRPGATTSAAPTTGVPAPQRPEPASDDNPRLRSLEHWSGPGATRITLTLDRPVTYEAYRLHDPERIYFDLHGLRLVPELVHNNVFSERSALLSRIRVAQFDAETVRIVVDLKGPYRYSAVLLTGPPRLLVEIFDKVQPAPPPAGASASAASQASKQVAGLPKGFRIVIDPGHGGNDLGTVGPGGLQEKQLALDISERLAKLLRTTVGAEVVLTRGDDRYVGLEARTQAANAAHADLFVSIHGNSSADRGVGGIETYFFAGAPPSARSLPGGGLTEVATLDREDRQFARDVQQTLYSDLAKTSHLRNRGVRTAPLVVLKGAAMPAILVEISFLSSPAEEKNLRSSEYRQQIVAALCRGIVRHAAKMQRAQTTMTHAGN